MCTAISIMQYFGRNLDLDRSYGQLVTVAPRNFPLSHMDSHSAIIGMATVAKGYPLFFEGTNEWGLSVAALNFPGNAVYHKPVEGKENIPSYDFISHLLTRCRTCRDAEALLSNAVICDSQFAEDLPATPLHWLIADKRTALVAESTDAGLQLYDDPIGILTNNPPFPIQLERLQNGEIPADAFSSRGRFMRAAYIRTHAVGCDVSLFFRMLDAVSVPEGCVEAEDGYLETLYSCCCDTEKGIYYYTTAENRQITAVDMHKLDLNSTKLHKFHLVKTEQINWVNP